jgi:hypothetical protein
MASHLRKTSIHPFNARLFPILENDEMHDKFNRYELNRLQFNKQRIRTQMETEGKKLLLWQRTTKKEIPKYKQQPFRSLKIKMDNLEKQIRLMKEHIRKKKSNHR